MDPASSTEMVGLMPPPPGVTPDFYHTTAVQTRFIVVFVVTFVLATVALLLRVYTRAFVVKSIGLDERMHAPAGQSSRMPSGSPKTLTVVLALLISSWAVTLAFFLVSVKAMPAGFGRNMYEVSQTQIVGYLERLLSLALTYLWPPTLTKLSILVLYWRISPNRAFRVCIVALAVVLVGYTATFSALFVGPCNPNRNTPESATCLNNIAVSQAVLNIVTDGVIIVLPIPTIHRLNMGLKQRLTVGLILALGSAACVASIVRIAYVRAMVTNPDFTYTQCAAAVWSLLEMNLGILCNSLAALKPFVRKHMPGIFSSYGWGGKGHKSGQSGPSKRSKRSKPGGTPISCTASATERRSRRRPGRTSSSWTTSSPSSTPPPSPTPQ
ncbi:hypothetical protein VTH06DRAFT_5268 [Thermothelomyces fergusii]